MALTRLGKKHSIALSLLAATALTSSTAFSQSFTIQPGAVAGPQTMSGIGDTGTVKTGGTIRSTADFESAVEMAEPDQKLTNDGRIETLGDHSFAVYSQGDGTRVTNNGSMIAAGSGSFGIVSFGKGSVIVNNGLLRASNDALGGIFAAGENTQVTNKGTVEVDGTNAFGIFGAGNNSTIANSGTITIEGEDAYAVLIVGKDSSAANSGAIQATGIGSIGILAVGSGHKIQNTGTINVTGKASAGILVDAASVTVSNGGSIRTSGTASYGVFANGDSTSVVNNGAIYSSGQASGGIVVGGNDASISNTGVIRASGSAAIGIGVGMGVGVGPGDGAVIRNSGSIIVSGANSTAVGTEGKNAVVTNSGTILNNGGVAIFFGGDNARLNLLSGTAIQGQIGFLGVNNTASFGSGLNAVITFSGVGLPETILTGGRPFVVSGDTVAVLDPADFRGAHAVVTDLTGNIAGAIEDRLALARNTGFGEIGLRGPIVADGVVEPAAPLGPVFWTTAIGSYRSESHSGDDAGFRTSLGGVLVGFDAQVSDLWRAGAFVGGAGGSVHVDNSGHDRSNSSFFGGGYLGYAGGLNFADLSLSVGSLRQNADRRIANNMVLGGIETAHANVDGVFVSPAVTFGTHMAMGDTIVVSSLRLRYAGLFLDSYSETGGSDALRVDSRNVNVFEARGQIALPLAPQVTDNGVWATALRAGIDGIAQSSGRVSATMLGQDISFTSDDHKGVVRGFAGADFTSLNDSRMQLQGTVELGYGSDRAFTAVARAGLSIPF